MHDRKVMTDDGLLILAGGGTLQEALAADDAAYARWAADEEAERELRQLEIRRRRLANADLQTKIEARLRRRQRRSGGSGPAGDATTQATP